MNNETIIANEAVASGYFTEEEIKSLKEQGKSIPFHTYSSWRSLGFIPRKGEHGWQTKLWQKRDNMDGKKTKQEFYLAKGFLFHISQCEKIEDTVS